MGPVLYILCGNSSFNRGDRGNLHAQIALLRERFPDARIIVGSHRAAVDRDWYDAEVIDRGMPFSRAQLSHLRQADAVVWGGGALLADNAGWLLVPYWAALLTFIRRVLRKPVIAWGHGIVLDTALGRFFGRVALNCADTVTVRDAGSLEAVRRLGVRPPVTLTADPAILVEAAGRDAGTRILQSEGIPRDDRPLVAIAPTFWPFYHRPTDTLPYVVSRGLGLRSGRAGQNVRPYLDALAALADRLAERLHARVVFLPRYPCALWPDVVLLDDAVSRMRHPEHGVVLRGDGYAPAEYFALWHHFRCVVSVALHDAIFSAALGVPCVQIHYEPKGHDFAAALGAEAHSMSLREFLSDGGPERAADLAQRLVNDWASAAPAQRDAVDALRADARRNADVLEQLLAVFPPGR